MKTKTTAGVIGAVVVAIVAIASPADVRAHCDALDGPVVTDARAALKAGRVDRVLKWISAEQEAEVRAAFAKTLRVRALGDHARELADHYFFETLVRLHRATEGAPYTGLRAAGSAVEPGVDVADKALRSGSSDALLRAMSRNLKKALKRRFDRAIRLRRVAERSPADGRRYVAAYVEYIHYVRRVHLTVAGAAKHDH